MNHDHLSSDCAPFSAPAVEPNAAVNARTRRASLWLPPSSDRTAAKAAKTEASIRDERTRTWRQAVSAALDDHELAVAVTRVTTPVAGLDRPCVPLARAQLVAWAVTAQRAEPDVPLAAALRAALASSGHAQTPEALSVLPPPPPADGIAADLSKRLATLFEASCEDGLEL